MVTAAADELTDREIKRHGGRATIMSSRVGLIMFGLGRLGSAERCRKVISDVDELVYEGKANGVEENMRTC